MGHIDLASLIFPAGTAGCHIDALARTHLWAAGADCMHGMVAMNAARHSRHVLHILFLVISVIYASRSTQYWLGYLCCAAL
jgi:Xaa-Pro aminopeptidase